MKKYLIVLVLLLNIIVIVFIEWVGGEFKLFWRLIMDIFLMYVFIFVVIFVVICFFVL